MKTTGIVLDVARQSGGAMPGIVTLHDHSRFGNDGAMTDITWTQLPSGLWVPVFNGATSYSNHGTDNSLIQISPRITVLAWVKGAVSGVTRSVASKFEDFDRNWDLGSLADSNVLSGFISDDGAVGAHCKSYYSSIVVWDNTWHQVGMVFDAGTFELVIDGAFDPSPTKTLDGATATIHHGTTATCIGCALFGGVPSWYFDGNIALVRIYTYALTPAQIRSRYTATRRLFGV